MGGGCDNDQSDINREQEQRLMTGFLVNVRRKLNWNFNILAKVYG